MIDRWKIIIVNRGKRYRKVTRKGGIHNRKWRPLMVPVATAVIMGAGALLCARHDSEYSRQNAPYFDSESPDRPRIVEVSSALWEKIKKGNPGIVEKCDLFRRVTRLRDGILMEEDVPA